MGGGGHSPISIIDLLFFSDNYRFDTFDGLFENPTYTYGFDDDAGFTNTATYGGYTARNNDLDPDYYDNFYFSRT